MWLQKKKKKQFFCLFHCGANKIIGPVIEKKKKKQKKKKKKKKLKKLWDFFIVPRDAVNFDPFTHTLPPRDTHKHTLTPHHRHTLSVGGTEAFQYTLSAQRKCVSIGSVVS